MQPDRLRMRDAEAIDACRELAKAATRSALHRSGRPPNSELVADCQQAAVAALWVARDRLAALPQDQWESYGAACARHAAAHLLAKEGPEAQHTVALADLEGPDGEPVAIRTEGGVQAEVLLRLDLLDQVEDSRLYAALLALPPRAYLIINLACQAYDDREIARNLRTTPAAVQWWRLRAVRLLRKQLCGGRAGA